MRSRKTRTPPCRPRARATWMRSSPARIRTAAGPRRRRLRRRSDGNGLAALAKYRDNSTVSAAVDAGWTGWSGSRSRTGRSSPGHGEQRVSLSVLVALTELGISLEDERFYKNHATLEDVLLRFRQENGSFSHTLDGGSDLTATTQALYALAAHSGSGTAKPRSMI